MESEKMKIVTPKFQKTIQKLIDNLQAGQFSDVEEYELARKHNALPLGVDMWSHVFLTADGKIIWDDNDGEIESVSDLQSLIRALVANEKRYPPFRQFIPNRSPDSRNCPVCEGSGIWERSKDISTGNPGRCLVCAGLGWVTNKTYSEILKNDK